MDVNPVLLAMITGVLLPLVVGVLTKLDAPSGLKAGLLAALAALSGYLVNVVSDTGIVEWQPVLESMGYAAIAAWSSYVSLLKPLGVAPAVQKATAGFGLGKG